MLEIGFVEKFDGCWMNFVRMIKGSIVGRRIVGGVKVVYRFSIRGVDLVREYLVVIVVSSAE